MERLRVLDGIVLIYIMIVLVFLFTCTQKTQVVRVLPKEGFCTCRGAQFNNSSGDPNQQNCYKDRIPPRIWRQSYAGCTHFDDPGKISYAYNVDEKQLPDFAGV
jgi:hypothetical protein